MVVSNCLLIGLRLRVSQSRPWIARVVTPSLSISSSSAPRATLASSKPSTSSVPFLGWKKGLCEHAVRLPLMDGNGKKKSRNEKNRQVAGSLTVCTRSSGTTLSCACWPFLSSVSSMPPSKTLMFGILGFGVQTLQDAPHCQVIGPSSSQNAMPGGKSTTSDV